MITIVPYDPTWPSEFIKLARPLRDTLGLVAVRIDHIGSTSVPGLPAKDIIDIQITVADFEEPLTSKLESLGFTRLVEYSNDHRPPTADGPDSDWEKRYFKRPTEMRPMNLHVRAERRPNQRYPILFRDYLRGHPMATGAYALIKQHLSRMHPDDIEFYYDIKDPVCDIVIDAAEEWARLTSWHMGPSDA